MTERLGRGRSAKSYRERQWLIFDGKRTCRSTVVGSYTSKVSHHTGAINYCVGRHCQMSVTRHSPLVCWQQRHQGHALGPRVVVLLILEFHRLEPFIVFVCALDVRTRRRRKLPQLHAIRICELCRPLLLRRVSEAVDDKF